MEWGIALSGARGKRCVEWGIALSGARGEAVCGVGYSSEWC